MVESQYEFEDTIQAVHATMRAVKSRLKCTAVLRNLTDLVPVLDKEIPWSSEVGLSKRFTPIRKQLIQQVNMRMLISSSIVLRHFQGKHSIL